jgi:hypothetical protein
VPLGRASADKIGDAQMGMTKRIVLFAALAVHVGCGGQEQREQRGAAVAAPSKKETVSGDSGRP